MAVEDFDGNHKLLDLDGNLITDFGKGYERVGTFSEGISKVKINEKFGYIN